MCLCRTSENCKSLVLQDKCNIKIFLSSVFASISAVTSYLEGVYLPAIANLCQNDLSDDMEAQGLVEILRQFLRIKAIGEFNSFLSRERSGSVVECLTRDRRAAGSSLTGVTALCP